MSLARYTHHTPAGRSVHSPGPPESLGMERMKETAPTEAVGCRIDSGQAAKTEILVYFSVDPARTVPQIELVVPQT